MQIRPAHNFIYFAARRLNSTMRAAFLNVQSEYRTAALIVMSLVLNMLAAIAP